jgi:DNA-binding Lrp family transcriptional regulator
VHASSKYGRNSSSDCIVRRERVTLCRLKKIPGGELTIYKTILLLENSQRRLQKVSLDSRDLKILNLLAKNGRLSYRSIGHAIGMTTKSVKSRVDRMLAAKVIERFIAKVNPSVVGYNRTYALALRKNNLNQELLERINLVGDIQHQFEVMGGAIGFDIAVKEGTEDKIELLLSSLKPALLGVIRSQNREVSQKLSETDYTIIKQLIINPRMEIGDIAAATTISPKTVRRRLDKMVRNRVLEFSIQPNPDAMKGYIVFFLDVKVKDRSHHQKVLQKIYEVLDDHFMILSSDISNQEDSIGLLLGSEDAIGIESIRSRIESFDVVKQANVFLPVRLSSPQEWILKAIDKKLAESSWKEREL